MKDLIKLKKYPIGHFVRPEIIDSHIIRMWINSIESLPDKVEELLKKHEGSDLNVQYRPGSWTVRQLVHHLPDSHMHGYIRTKWTLTEDNPKIKAYNENAWSLLSDVENTDVFVSVELLKNIHTRWVTLLRELNTAELKRTFYHLQNKKTISISELTGIYAWHGQHHLAHMQIALEENL